MQMKILVRILLLTGESWCYINMDILNRKIEVFDKDRQYRVAIFSNNQTNNADDSIEQLINPTISKEQNGISILTFSIASKSQKWQDINNPTYLFECDNMRFTALDKGSFKNNGSTITVTLKETQCLLARKYIQAYNTPKDRENIDNQTVVLLPKSDDVLMVNGKSYNDNEVRDSRGIIMPRGSAGYNLWAILRDSEWELGICDVIVDGFSPSEDYGVFNIETDRKDVLYNINLIQELYGGILVYDSINQIVHLRDEEKWDTDNGFFIKKGRNATNIEISYDNDIYTVIEPTGEGNLNIEKVNNGSRYITNFSFTDQWYHINLANPNIYDQKQLKFWGERKSKELGKPRIKVVADIVDLRNVEGYEQEDFNLNDIVTIKADSTKEKQRIISMSYGLWNYANTTITLGDKFLNRREILKQVFKSSNTTDSIINDNNKIDGDNITVDYEKEGISSSATITKIANDQYAEIKLNTQFIKETDEKHTQADAEIKVYVDDTKAEIKQTTDFIQNDYNGKIATANTSIKQLSDNTQAKIESLTSYVNGEISETNTYINQVSNSLGSEINAVSRYVDDVDDNVASLTLKVNSQGSEIRLKADKTYVDSEMLIVNGNISALNAKFDSLDVVGQITAGSLSVSTINFQGNSARIARQRVITDLEYKKKYFLTSGTSISVSKDSKGYVTDVRLDKTTDYAHIITSNPAQYINFIGTVGNMPNEK